MPMVSAFGVGLDPAFAIAADARSSRLVLGKSGPTKPAPTPAPAPAPPVRMTYRQAEESGPPIVLYVAGGVAALAVAGLVVFKLRKKK